MFRLLKASEIDARIGTIKENKGLTLLLYKDARCDMNILDEKFGAYFWARVHKELKNVIYCGVSVYNRDIEKWVTKWDAGAESFSEKEKGEASDSFKRACVNWGIGRELYTAPFIWINHDKVNIKKGSNGKPICYTKFKVKSISYNDNREISNLEIIDDKGVVLYSFGKNSKHTTPKEEEPLTEIMEEALNNVNGCKTEEKLTTVWRNYANLQNNDTFKLSVINRRKAINKKS
jgi:hypothetical protein